MDSNDFSLPTSQIVSVKFQLTGSDEALNESYVKITSPDLLRENLPYPGGPLDAHMGTPDHGYKCQTCHGTKKICLGHEGYLELNYPVWNPFGLKDGKKWLKLICFNCGKPIIPDSAFMSVPKTKRLDSASATARTMTKTNKKCHYCGTPHPLITSEKDHKEPLELVGKMLHDGKVVETITIYPHMAKEYFDKVTDETVRKLGKPYELHPRKCILTRIKVSAVNTRSDIKKASTGRHTNDDITIIVQSLIRKSEKIPTILPSEINRELDEAIWFLNNTYYEMIRASGEGAVNSYGNRFKGKGGLLRKHGLGKRVHKICRSTIVGHPQLKIDEVAISQKFATTVQMEEIVQEYNKKRLALYVLNGRNTYPGASAVRKWDSKQLIYTDSGQDIELEIGDKVYRDMITGDPAPFNRQPSLKICNISTMRVVVMPNKKYKTLVMNVISCVLFDADFDGDQMNLIINSKTITQNEVAEVNALRNYMISHITSGPILGQVDDSVIGPAVLTGSNVQFNKYHAMLLFQHTTFMPSFKDMKPQDLISGRACVSKLFKNTPINFERTASWYEKKMTPYINYDPDEITVKIERGQLISGILDKATIGKGANGGIYHIIANEYGTSAALDSMYNLQQLAIAYLMQFGFTIGIKDLLITPESKHEIDMRVSDIINKSLLITEELHNGEIIPPINQTVKQFYEEQQKNILSISDEFTDPIMRSIDPNTNHLFKLMMTGSKGKPADMNNIICVIGPKIINGKLIEEEYGVGRTAAYFPRFDSSPKSRGFITNSYLSGMTPSEYIFNAMAARFDLITRALTTAVTGAQNRTSIKNLESIIINNFRLAAKFSSVVQWAYGGDFLDPRKVERVKMPTVMISDAALREKYYHEKFPHMFDKIVADRDKYRTIYLALEQTNIRDLISDERQLPVNVGRIIVNVIREYGKSVIDESKLADAVNAVDTFCEELPYVFINSTQRKLRSAVPENMVRAAWLVSMLVRSHLHPKMLATLSQEVVSIVLDKIWLTYQNALIEPGTAVGIIAAQSFSAPLTQYMLDAQHRSASGGTSKSGMVKVKDTLGGKDVADLSNATMLIPVLPKYAYDRNKVQEIANSLEELSLERFVTISQIFYEKYGQPVHETTLHEKKLIENFEKNNPLLRPPGDLIRWCIRLVLNKTTLILKNMSIETLVAKIRDQFSDTYVVYSPENDEKVIIRIYMRAVMFKNVVVLADVVGFLQDLNNILIRGVRRIISARVVEMIRSKIDDDGSVAREKDMWGIETDGTNLAGILSNEYVDGLRVQTNSSQETASVLGIMSSRYKISAGLKSIIDNINPRHYMVYADEMTYTGVITPIESSGIKKREASNILLQMGYGSPINTIEHAANNGISDEISGVSAPIILGNVPKLGTIYNTFHVSEEFVQENVKQADDIIASLWEQ